MRKWMCLLISIIFLSGCWDERLLKESKLIYSAGFDLTEDNQIEVFTALPPTGPYGKSKIISTIADTPREAKLIGNLETPELLDSSKMKFLLLGEELAKTGVYPYIDIFYRDPRNGLAANMFITKGKTNQYYDIDQTSTTVSDYISDLHIGAVKQGMIPRTNMQYVCTILFDPGRDNVLPYLTYDEEDMVPKIDGLALLDDGKLTDGRLDWQESTMFTIMSKFTDNKGSFSLKVFDGKEPSVRNYATYRVIRVKTKYDFDVTSIDSVKVKITMNMRMALQEYPEEIFLPAKGTKTKKKAQEELQKIADTVVAKLLESQSDALGIGSYIASYHPDKWEADQWEEQYKSVQITPIVKVSIEHTGVID